MVGNNGSALDTAINTMPVIAAFDSGNTLKVNGNSGDHIALQDSGWVDDGSHGFYHTYTHDDAVLLVGANVTVGFVTLSRIRERLGKYRGKFTWEGDLNDM